MQVLYKRQLLPNFRLRLPKINLLNVLRLIFLRPKLKKQLSPGVYEEFNPIEKIERYKLMM